MSFQIGPLMRQHRIDLILVFALMLLGGVGSYLRAQRIDPLFLHANDPQFRQRNIGDDVYFQADLPRVFTNMTQRTSNQYRTKVHPLFPIATVPAVSILRKSLGFEQLTAVRLFTSVIAALWVGALFAALRLLGCRRLDAICFSLAGMVSAASIFWFAVPETYGFGSLTIILALVFVGLTQYRDFSEKWYMVIGAMTMSGTVTNWMAGIAAGWVNLPWRRVVQVSVNAFFVVTVLWAVQKLAFPSTQFFLDQTEERDYILSSEMGGPLRVLLVFFLHSAVMPAAQVVKIGMGQLVLSVQRSLPGSGGFWGATAGLAWGVVLCLGLWGFYRAGNNPRLRSAIGLVLLGQLGLHLLYGEETFLYSLHFVPLLILVAACSTLSGARRVALPLVCIFIISAAVNNWMQFSRAANFFEDADIKPRADLIREQLKRPADLWPRGEGHVVLALPGSREADKSYHEPGGSFSPTVGSFGISVWVVDSDGTIIATSDLLPLAKIRQSLQWNGAEGYSSIPSIVTDTPYYRSEWTITAHGRWELKLNHPDLAQKRELVVLVRSAGPAGGAIQALDWNGRRLLINDRWTVNIESAPLNVSLGDERQPDWKSRGEPVSHWKDVKGWGYARLELGGENKWSLTIEDHQRSAPGGLSASSTRSTVRLDLPDPRFEACLNAQVAHLLMSLVGKETRPGDPNNAPIPWQRDGAYTISALAHAGQLGIAKELSEYLAVNDFYGGFGAEADAPGLALWALREVASRLDDAEYDRWLWPHVLRKADFILEMMFSKQPIHRKVTNPIVPAVQHRNDNTLVAEPSRKGLIVGWMDHHQPALYVNAVSYRGLMDAAWIAQRLQHSQEVERWLDGAARLKAAWERAFVPPESRNDRTYISALWPTRISEDAKDTLRANLEFRWAQRRDDEGGFLRRPLWTDFDIAEAHQWLYLEELGRVWDTLRWFWENQASAGLYTWWEDNGEGNTYYLWHRVRGWVRPRHVTPHYWAAAEMLLLQMDMLAYLDESTSPPCLVIGAGIPAHWFDRPLKVEGLQTPYGTVNWYWNDSKLDIVVGCAPSHIGVRLGASFPVGSQVRIEYRESPHKE
jgi:hypothetical protein